jgi:hypothetical protein
MQLGADFDGGAGLARRGVRTRRAEELSMTGRGTALLL